MVEAKVCRHLNAHGYGAPEVVPALDGSSVVEYNGDVWMMYDHLKGKTPTWNRRLRSWHLRGSITGLACYHKAVSTLDPGLDTGRIRSDDYERITSWLEDLKSLLAADTSGRASVEKMRPLVDQYLELSRRLPELYPADQVERCEKLMIHGYFHAFNIMFRWFRFSSCYDFDFIRRDTKLPDVLWTLQFYQRYLYRKRWGDKVWQQGFLPDLEAVRQIETTALRRFVQLYNKTYRLTPEEVALLPGMSRGTGRLEKRITGLAVPLIINNVLFTLTGFVDSLMVGQLGEDTISAVGNAAQVQLFLFLLFAAIGQGGSILVAQAFGAKDEAQLRSVSSTIVASGFLIGLLVALATWFGGEAFLWMLTLGRSPEVVALGTTYLQIVAFSYVLLIPGNMVSSVLRSVGDTKTPVKIAVAANILNVVGNAVLIFGLGPFPALGYQGSAIATLVAQTLQGLALIWFLTSAASPLRFRWSDLVRIEGPP